ncbi:MAG: hypothetical protein K6T83_22815 [Alicyclobacillus sp.]|nr:hypothetical protein [Alicyclobacillus sp.]
MKRGVMKMQIVYRTIAWVIVAIVAFVIISVFIGFLLKLALLGALIAFGYYWFMRALSARRDRPWR